MKRVKIQMTDPVFFKGEEKTAKASLNIVPAGMVCTAELWLSKDRVSPEATTGQIPFVSAGAEQSITLPITMPGPGEYPVLLDVEAGGAPILLGEATEKVIIQHAPEESIPVPELTARGFTCPYCGETIVRSWSDLSDHINTEHPGEFIPIDIEWEDGVFPVKLGIVVGIPIALPLRGMPCTAELWFSPHPTLGHPVITPQKVRKRSFTSSRELWTIELVVVTPFPGEYYANLSIDANGVLLNYVISQPVIVEAPPYADVVCEEWPIYGEMVNYGDGYYFQASPYPEVKFDQISTTIRRRSCNGHVVPYVAWTLKNNTMEEITHTFRLVFQMSVGQYARESYPEGWKYSKVCTVPDTEFELTLAPGQIYGFGYDGTLTCYPKIPRNTPAPEGPDYHYEVLLWLEDEWGNKTARVGVGRR